MNSRQPAMLKYVPNLGVGLLKEGYLETIEGQC